MACGLRALGFLPLCFSVIFHAFDTVALFVCYYCILYTVQYNTALSEVQTQCRWHRQGSWGSLKSSRVLFHCVFMCLNTVLTSILKLQRVNISLLHVSWLKCAEFCFLIPPVQWIIWKGCQPIEIKLRLHTITTRICPRDFPCLPKALLLTSAVNVLLYLLWKRL